MISVDYTDFGSWGMYDVPYANPIYTVDDTHSCIDYTAAIQTRYIRHRQGIFYTTHRILWGSRDACRLYTALRNIRYTSWPLVIIPTLLPTWYISRY